MLIKSVDRKIVDLSKRVSGGFLVGILIASFIYFLHPDISHADGIFGGFIDIGYTVISKLMFGITWIVALIGGVIVSVIIFVLQMVITMSDQIVNSRPVQIGFPIVLSVANLGFVTAIIAIAIGTILRSQTYNMKKMLANVVIMAVLVNFGLVVSGAIIGLSNRVTTYFLDSMTGGNVFNFATMMAQTMNPQKAILSFEGVNIAKLEDGSVASSTATAADKGFLAELGKDATTKSIGSYLVPIVSAMITVVQLILMIITLSILVFSFIIRYIKLTFALILLPGAWMASVFPSLKKWNSQWWDLFIKQVFYPPVVLFFLWLAMRIQADLANSDGLTFAASSNSSGAAGLLTNIYGNIISVPVQTLLQGVVIAGLMLGGDYVAKSMGAAGAGAALKASGGMQKWAGGKAKYFGQRAGVRALDTSAGKKATEKLAALGASRGPAGRLMTMPARALGFKLANVKEKMKSSTTKYDKDDISKMGEEEKLLRAKSATGLELAALLDDASKNPKLMAKIVGSLSDKQKQELAENKDLYERYGYGKTHEAANLEDGETGRKAYEGNVQPAKEEYEKVKNDPSATEEQKKEAQKKFEDSIEKFAETIKKISPDGAHNLLFGKDEDGEFKMDKEMRATMMQALTGPKGWNPGKFNEFLQKASDSDNLSEISSLFEGANPQNISKAVVKALENGALKNLAIDGEAVMGKELFEKAKEIHGIGDDNKKKDKKGGPTTATFE